MAAPRASIAVSVTRAGLTLATAFALTRVFAGRSWLFVMVLAAVVPPVVPRLGAAPPLAPLVAVRGGRSSSACGWRRSSPIPRPPSPASRRRATLATLGHAISAAPRTRCAPRSCRCRPTGSALVLAFVGVFVAAALTHWIATSLDAPIGAFAPSIALFIVDRRDRQRRLGLRRPRCTRSRRSATCSRSRSTTSTPGARGSTPTRPRGSRLAAGGVLVGAIAVASALAVGPSVPGRAAAARSSTTASLGARQRRGQPALGAAADPQHPRQAHARPGRRSCSRSKAPRAAYWRVIALDWFTDDNAWGINKATERAASKLTTPDRPAAVARRCTSSSTSTTLDPHWLPGRVPAGRDQPHRGARRARLAHAARRLDEPSSTTSLYDVDSEIPTPTSRRELAGDAVLDPREWRATSSSRPTSRDRCARSREQITAEARTSPYERGRRAREVLPQRHVQVHARHQPRRLARRDRRSSSSNTRGRILRAVRGVVRGDGPRRRPAGTRRGRLPAGHARHRRPVPRDEPQRARLARGVDRRRGLDPVRADARFAEPTLGLGTGGPTQRPHESATDDAGRRRRRPRGRRVADRRRSEAARPTRRQLAAAGRLDARTGRRSSVGHLVALAIVAVALGGRSRSLAHRRADRARGAPHVAPPPRRRSAPARARRVGRGARPSPRRRASRRGRRRRRWSSRCATHPRTARATPARR